ncbi:hypothetical protein FMM80_10220 [Schaedlerella arabinosiphila]|uniref:Uncharacterized protein n=1 Tax=Schaedlerella arabinosiphila TaxID=2044587 RepID=A0A9X5C7F3_9FIRM|nr:hypothetical protein [Schaedlerella arabinosiphila]NDO69035.1 hypothetical protein [Schaedlerella arabinosiphila]
MTERIWTRSQCVKISELEKNYRMPEKVVAEIYKAVDMLDKYYGMDRDVDKDDGGYVFLILPEHVEKLELLYLEVLGRYRLDLGDAEYKDIIYDNGFIQWHSDLYLVSNDYCLNIVYYTKKRRR